MGTNHNETTVRQAIERAKTSLSCDERQRLLIDPDTGKLWRYHLKGSQALIEAGKPDKPRSSTKRFDTPAMAAEYLVKQQWSKLKAGYLLINSAAAPGDPVLHTFVGGGYTGMLALAASNDHLFCCCYKDNHDVLLVLDETGQRLYEAVIPDGRLVFDMTVASEAGLLLLNADHGILGCSLPVPNRFRAISQVNLQPASCLSAARSRVLVFEDPRVAMKQMPDGEILFSVERKPEKYGGHSPQMCAALNRQGDVLALCSQPGEVELFDVASAKPIAVIKGDFNMIAQLAFDGTGDCLIGIGRYGPWGPIFFDTAAKSIMDAPVVLPPLREGTVHMAMDSQASRMALTSWDRVYVIDTTTWKQTATVALEHVVKRAQTCFFRNRLAIRTDYGCLSLYALPEHNSERQE